MATLTKAIGLKTKLMALEYIYMFQALNTTDSGTRINSTGTVRKNGQTALSISATMLTGLRRVTVSLSSKTVEAIKVSSQEMKFMVKAHMFGLMESLTLETGA